MTMQWQWLGFEQMSGAELYQTLALRQEVFILEQRCFYRDLDGHDLAAWHLLGWRTVDGQRRLSAYLRCLAPGVKFAEMSLGRVVTALDARGSGIGRELLEQGIAGARRRFPDGAIRIAAQQYLEQFYRALGFETVCAPYDEDGIAHVDMLRPASGPPMPSKR
ncbi:MAG: GNAT family N-acetyltransferase [Pseudomonadota bacterium]